MRHLFGEHGIVLGGFGDPLRQNGFGHPVDTARHIVVDGLCLLGGVAEAAGSCRVGASGHGCRERVVRGQREAHLTPLS
ncbi:hypothetical protein [Streptomyces sp. V2I9]|uniref:hypothetical protein n=1 Tax=Streptomyces sp. V2I9 TaxID=3042304 RepID=UPI0027879579|nr:hypothetical protein [Streptomyces sp. V2I9]MDQ0983374.1 hypothetical protein [Streptomyces sp. V2I9]